MMKRISIAMCTFNGEAFLQKQLQSIAEQSLAPSELVVCDDGSSDSTAEIVTDFSRHAPFPVRFVKNSQNLGSTKNFEQAISLCSGDYIALCDQDDFWEPQKLQVLAEELQSSTAGGVFSDGMQVSADGSSLGRTLWNSVRFHDRTSVFLGPGNRKLKIAHLLRGNMVTGATLMVRAELRPVISPFPREWVHDGWIAWMLALHSDLIAVRQQLIRYRVHGYQQVGAPQPGIRSRIERARLHGTANYASQAAQFSLLLQYVESRPELSGADLIGKLAEKINFSWFRSRLPRKHMLRSVQILSRARQYHDYAQGWYSMTQDVIL